MRILIIEDEKNLARFLELELKDSGYQVDIADNGRDGLAKALTENYQLLIVDWMLPERDGLLLVQEVKRRKNVPIIMITAKESIESEIESLDKGADDYLKKPFDNRQLLARVAALLRRSEQRGDMTVLRLGAVLLDTTGRQLTIDGRPVDLSKTEFDLLAYLMSHSNQVLSRDQILERCWGYDRWVDTNVIDVYINRLRKKLDSSITIKTVRGLGYRIME